ncbi:FG-GAP-like repeat-containing protein [Streptomyces sp. NPDC003027]
MLISALLAVGLVPQSAVAATVPNGSVVPATITKLGEDPSRQLASTESESGPVPPEQKTRFAQYITAAEVGGMPKASLSDILTYDLNAAAKPLCHPTNAAGAQGFCWDDTWGDDSKMAFVPQGLTGSGESPANEGVTGGRRVLVASWHSDHAHPTYATDELMRVTFADVTNPAAVRYRHALLVTPTASGFAALPGHAHSVTWYKNYLYVSTGAGLAVFDLTRIWRMDESGGTVGTSAGKHYAAWHKYALPQVDRFHNLRADPSNCGTYNSTPEDTMPPCFTGVSLDDSGREPALVTTEGNPLEDGEQQTFGDAGEIVRWPLDRDTGLPKTEGQTGIVRPVDAFRSTIGGAQGGAMNRGRVVVSAPCPEFVAGGSNIPSCLYHAWPGEPVRLWTRTGINNENVSYWPATDELWTINEFPGDRTVFHIRWPKPELPLRSLSGTWGDLTGDGRPDLLAVRPHASTAGGAGNGNLVLYPGAVSTLGIRTSIGTGWDSMPLLSGIGDLNADARPDMLAVDSGGQLWLYPGTEGGLGPRVQLSTGWGDVRAMTGTGDLTGDGLPDLMAVWKDGTAHLYPGKPGGLGTRRQIGTGWNTIRLLTGAGDLNTDGRPDVLAVDSDGQLWLYPGTDTGLGARAQLSTGWGGVQAMTGTGDLTDDGRPDLMAILNDGTAHLYPGTATGGLGTRRQIGTGWNTTRLLTGAGDLNTDGRPDVLAVDGNGKLWLYPGAVSALGIRTSIGTGWDSMPLLSAIGDLNADARPDMLAVDSGGQLWLYPGTEGGLGPRVQLSTGWGDVRAMTGTGDLTGDGLPDLMAVWKDGTAHLYPGKPGGLGTRRQIGTGWNTIRLLTGAGDLNTDGRPDVLAVDSDGQLWLYPGTDTGLGPRAQLSTGWGGVQAMTGTGDLTDDGLPDLMAILNDGTAHLYPGTATGGLGARTAVDLGWGTP